jgi:hypothetical protein
MRFVKKFKAKKFKKKLDMVSNWCQNIWGWKLVVDRWAEFDGWVVEWAGVKPGDRDFLEQSN